MLEVVLLPEERIILFILSPALKYGCCNQDLHFQLVAIYLLTSLFGENEDVLKGLEKQDDIKRFALKFKKLNKVPKYLNQFWEGLCL